MQTWKRIRGNVAAAAVALVISLFVTEAALRTLYPRSERHYVLAPGQTTTLRPLEEHVPGVSSPVVYRTSSQGVRGEEFSDADDYRILAIGGSTTQNGYLDQSRTWTLILADLLEASQPSISTWSGDIGRSGHTARSHLLQLRHTVPELPGIDAVVMLVGVNDLTVALREGFEYTPQPPLDDPEALRRQMREAFVQVPGRLHDRSTAYQEEDVPVVKRTAVYQLLRQVRNVWLRSRSGTQQDEFGSIYAVWRRHRAEASRLHDSLPDLTEPLAVYESYLRDISQTARGLDARLVLMTQPVAWRDDLSGAERARLWLGGIGDFQAEPGHEYFTAGALRRAMDAYNTVLLEVCATEPGVECLDLAAKIPADTTVFYDDVHYTDAGSEMIARDVAAYFMQRPPYGVDPRSTP